jgi:hypothetical protein
MNGSLRGMIIATLGVWTGVGLVACLALGKYIGSH